MKLNQKNKISPSGNKMPRFNIYWIWMALAVAILAWGILGGENVIQEKDPSLGVEDFAYFAAACPACFFHLGCGDPDHPEGSILHSCHFRADEGCIPLGIQLQVANVLRALDALA